MTAREPQVKRQDKCANCSVPVGVRITDVNGKIDMSKNSSNFQQAKVSAFIINADGQQSKVLVTDALNQIYKLNLVNTSQNVRQSQGSSISLMEEKCGGGSELFLCYQCSLIFPKLYKLFSDFRELRKVDSIISQSSIEIDQLIASRRFSSEDHQNISVRNDIFEETEQQSSLLEQYPFSAPFYLGSRSPSPEKKKRIRIARPLSSLFVSKTNAIPGDSLAPQAVVNCSSNEAAQVAIMPSIAGKVQRQYTKIKSASPKRTQRLIRILPAKSLLRPSPTRNLNVAKTTKQSSKVMKERTWAVRKPQSPNKYGKTRLTKISKLSVPSRPTPERPIVLKEEAADEDAPLPNLDFTVEFFEPEAMEYDPPSKESPCPNCSRPFPSEFLLKCHREYCRSPQEIQNLISTRKLKCPACSTCLEKKTLLLEHLKLHHPNYTYKTYTKNHSCQQCGVHFQQKKQLMTHLRTHLLNAKEEEEETMVKKLETVAAAPVTPMESEKSKQSSPRKEPGSGGSGDSVKLRRSLKSPSTPKSEDVATRFSRRISSRKRIHMRQKNDKLLR